MTSARRSHLGAAFALTAWVALIGVVGCGGGDRGAGDRGAGGAQATAKADAVVVTYYYLPG